MTNQTYYCRNCGANMTTPANGSLTCCAHCANRLNRKDERSRNDQPEDLVKVQLGAVLGYDVYVEAEPERADMVRSQFKARGLA